MDSSTAGKTTILDVITSHKSGGKINDKILSNGYEAIVVARATTSRRIYILRCLQFVKLGGGDEACDNRSATEPSFIFLDESTNGLDAHSERSSTMANSR
ncbi:hypothetical protein F443_07285 [Phytophthora nicotianae P1569]|uniref:Uncharacterized protein n=1 Tax=Phytophthora nicotianae P1569 TaxID=1317065 RepID=V9FB90_PHYNI|nr:hypothetical protein F443_07285 [Phytophthora nicotianae P1569]